MTARCSYPGCDRQSYCRGWCGMHYARWRTHGDPSIVLEAARPSLAERLRSKLVERDGCIEFTGARNPDGYGVLQSNYRRVMAHRLAFELEVGAIPEGLLVCHRCDNPPCCNPSHLFLGTVAVNAWDMAQKGRSLRRSRNPAARLTEEQFNELERRAANGEPKSHIARDLGVTPTAVGNYLKRLAKRTAA